MRRKHSSDVARQAVASVVVAALFFLAGGCTAQELYPGPTRPAGEVAVIELRGRRGGFVEAVDGRAVGGLWHDTLRVPPGEYVLRVRTRWTNRHRQSVDVVVNVDAGKTYHLYVRERCPRLNTLQMTGEAMRKGAILILWPITLPVTIGLYLIDYSPPHPPKGHTMEVGFSCWNGGGNAGTTRIWQGTGPWPEDNMDQAWPP